MSQNNCYAEDAEHVICDECHQENRADDAKVLAERDALRAELEESERARRVSRDRELRAQLAESGLRDDARKAIVDLDDMTLETIEQVRRVRERLVSMTQARRAGGR